MQRDNLIDTAKGLGIVAVIAGHLFRYGGGYSCLVFSFHMPLFFFLSGYVFNTDGTKKQFVYKELNLLLPYLFFSVLGLIVSLIIPAWRSFSIKDVFMEIFYNVNPNMLHIGQIWFLFALADIIAIMFAINFLFEKDLLKLLFCLFLFGICYIIKKHKIGIFYNANSYRIPLKIDDAFAGLLFFFLGILGNKEEITQKIKNIKLPLRILLFVISVVLLILLCKLNGMVNMDSNFNNPIYYLLSSCTGIMMILLFSSFIADIKLNFLAWYGKNSLSIFAIHSLFLYAYTFILSKALGKEMIIMDTIPDSWALVGTVFVMICAAPFALFYNISVGKVIHKINHK